MPHVQRPPPPPDAVSTLKSASPLAWRLLGRVRVRCPLHASGCSWRGDLSEVSAHLTNSQSHLGGKDYAADLSQANAEALKDQGNAKFQARAYREAIQLYSKAISAAPGVAAYYGNRAAAWLHIGAAEACAEDCRRAVAIDPGYVKGHLRLAKALCEMSDVDGARAAPSERRNRGPGTRPSRRNPQGWRRSPRACPRVRTRCARAIPRGRSRRTPRRCASPSARR